MPAKMKINMSVRVACEYLSLKKVTLWLDAIRLTPVVPETNWTPQEPSFVRIICGDEDKAVLVSSWCKSVICDPFISMIVDASSHLSILHPTMVALINVLERFLQDNSGYKAHADFIGSLAVTQTLATFKGIYALAHPAHFMLNFKIKVDDVAFVLPFNKKEAVNGEVLETSSAIPFGKGLARWLSKAPDGVDCSWKKRQAGSSKFSLEVHPWAVFWYGSA